ncbi:MAG: hypothetical protein ABIP39_11510 [Polyangiaceae bacterium]
MPFASTEPDERIVRLEKRVADLERQQEAASWDGAPTAKPPSVAPPPMAMPSPRAAEADRQEIKTLVKLAVDEATSALRAEFERKEKEKAREAPKSDHAEVRWSEAPRAPAPWGQAAAEAEPVRIIEAPRAAPVPVRSVPPVVAAPNAAVSVAPSAAPAPRASIAPLIEIPPSYEPLGFDIPEGLDGSARRRKVAWAAFVFFLLAVGGLIASMVASRNR